jgi:hypothetical protein
MMEAMDTSSRFNMNLRDDKRDTPVPFSWIKRSLVCSRFRLRKTKSGDLGSLAGEQRRLIAIKKAARQNKPLLGNHQGNHHE